MVTRVSLVATVRDEAGLLPEWLAGINAQTLVPDEIIIVDGGSSDGTWEALLRWGHCREGVQCLRCMGASIAEGRNRAIERATGSIVAVTDAGTRADPNWLMRLAAAFEDPLVDVAAGFFVPRLATGWERALAAATLPDAGEITPATFLPSSRSTAFRRSWFDAGVRFPEWLDYCEDVIWDLALRRAGARFTFVPDATVTFQVRPTLGAYLSQYFRYARGDGKAGLFARRHWLRYVTYSALVAVLWRRRWVEFGIAAVLGTAYLRRPLQRLWLRDRRTQHSTLSTARLMPLVTFLRLAGDVSKMVGYPIGLCWRRRTFGSIGWRTSWRRISPAGRLLDPAAWTTGSQPQTSSRDA
jgi:cellulose synthase/poly-beta-1,6-N-acetylglucosamine synthase-like glycosyltransferase